MAKQIIDSESRKNLVEGFSHFKDDIRILVFTKKGKNEQFNEFTIGLIREMAGLSEKIRPEFYDHKSPEAKKYEINRFPTVLIAPDRFKLRYTGAPAGEEGRSFVTTLMMASTGVSALSDDNKKRLEKLKEKRHVRVFVSPTCPYCPQQVHLAMAAAIQKPELVSTEVIEIYENIDLAEENSAMSVPKTFVGDILVSAGLQSEEEFTESLVQGKAVDYVMPAGRANLKDVDVAIIGGGPAGLTAAVYAERSGLKSVVFERANVGGQISITPMVENYTGTGSIAGKTLVELMARHAAEYAPLQQGVGVTSIERKGERFVIQTGKGKYTARAIIIATGATHKELGAKGEEHLSGRGVSYCSTCDGYIFKDGRKVLVVGGGNTAVTDALYLDGLGAEVTLIHRRGTLKAEKRLQDRLFKRKIPVTWNSVVSEIKGEKRLESVVIENNETGNKEEVKTDGLFISIGYIPVAGPARMLGLELDPEGYIKVDEKMRTSMPLVYAAGDVTGGVKQIVVAVGQGSVAAISAFEDLSTGVTQKSPSKDASETQRTSDK